MQLDDVQKEQALSAIRTLLAVGCGFLVGHGYFNEVTATEIMGALMALLPIAWGIINKRTSEQKTQVRVATAGAEGYAAGTSQMNIAASQSLNGQGVKQP